METKTKHTTVANAHLIAAAPDLYEALKLAERKYLQQIEDDRLVLRSGYQFPAGYTAENVQYIAAIRAAIAKAEGNVPAPTT